MSAILDAYVQRYQNLEPFNVYSVDAEGEVTPWYEVNGTIVQDLVLNDQAVGGQVQAIGAQIGHWARLVAQCKRVWEIEERNYRIWRSRTWLDLINRPKIIPGTSEYEEKAGWGRTAKGELKAPTKEQAEALYRVDPEYAEWQNKIERAEEAYNAAEGILQAFKAKRDALRMVVRRNRETGEVELSI